MQHCVWIYLCAPVLCSFERNNSDLQAEVPVNWCPALGTVLANEEVVDGVSERGGHPVIRKVLKLPECPF